MSDRHFQNEADQGNAGEHFGYGLPAKRVSKLSGFAIRGKLAGTVHTAMATSRSAPALAAYDREMAEDPSAARELKALETRHVALAATASSSFSRSHARW